MTTNVRIEHRMIGPRADPYSRTTYTAQVGPNHVRLIVCGLTGHALEINGAVQARWHFGDPKMAPSPVEEFERLVGASLDSIEDSVFSAISSDPMGHPSQYHEEHPQRS
jgi:hypothetical protein